MTVEFRERIVNSGYNGAPVRVLQFPCAATFSERISLQNASMKSGGSRNSDKCFVCCVRTRPCKAGQGAAFNGSNPTLSAISARVHVVVVDLIVG
jgi:hypothetical protein